MLRSGALACHLKGGLAKYWWCTFEQVIGCQHPVFEVIAWHLRESTNVEIAG